MSLKRGSIHMNNGRLHYSMNQLEINKNISLIENLPSISELSLAANQRPINQAVVNKLKIKCLQSKMKQVL